MASWDALYEMTVRLSDRVNNMRRALVEAQSGELKLLRWPHAVAVPRGRAAGLLADAA